MNDSQTSTDFDKKAVKTIVESALQIGLIFLLLVSSFDLIGPFIIPIVWGGIIAIAAMPLLSWIQSKLGGKRSLALIAIPIP